MNINENMFCDFRQPSIVIKNTLTVLKKRKRLGEGSAKAFPHPINTISCFAVELPCTECERCFPDLQLLSGLAGNGAHPSKRGSAGTAPFKLF